MNKEINLHRLRLVLRGALDYLNRDGGDINEALTAQGKVKLTVTMESIETALLWLRRMVEDALNDEEKYKNAPKSEFTSLSEASIPPFRHSPPSIILTLLLNIWYDRKSRRKGYLS